MKQVKKSLDKPANVISYSFRCMYLLLPSWPELYFLTLIIRLGSWRHYTYIRRYLKWFVNWSKRLFLDSHNVGIIIPRYAPLFLRKCLKRAMMFELKQKVNSRFDDFFSFNFGNSNLKRRHTKNVGHENRRKFWWRHLTRSVSLESFQLEELRNLACGKQGCQIFLVAWYQNRKKLPNEHKIYKMVINYPKCP
jgi:hypothetical protein